MANSTKISEYSTTAANNTSIDSIDIDENCAASGINNAIRSVLKHQADAFTQGTPIALDQTNNRVGIGKTPTYTLDIHGVTAIKDSESLTWQGGSQFSSAIVGSGSNNRLQFWTSANQRMTIKSDGKIGIGTDNPVNTFQVNGDAVRFYNSADTGALHLFSFNNSNHADYYMYTASGNNNVKISTSEASFFNGGQVLINATSTGSSTKLHVKNNNYLISCHNNGGTSGYFGQIQFLNNTDDGTIGSIQRVNNNSVNYNTTSDARLKENVADMTDGITRVKQLAPKRFSWIEEDLDTANQDGFLAHEAQAVVPLSATGTQNEVDDDGNPVYMQMDAAKLVPVLTAALKESIAKIETLETEMTALKARVTALEA